AAAVAYGRAFGDDTNGIVMYEGSHSIAGGSEEENVAAARVYGNFLLQAGIERRPQIKMDLLPVYNPNDDAITFNGEVSGIAPPFTYQWQDNCGGSFDDTSLLNATYIPDDTVEAQTCLLTLIVTDNCGRRNFTSFPVFFEIDIDGDNITKTKDLDDDNDGIPDVVEENGDPLRDTDGDGILDSSDLDSDNDGILDILEGGLTDAQIAAYDTNNDGFIDNTYVFGLNGLIDDYEISPESGTVDYDGNGFQDDFTNSDSDGSYNFQDIDADNDGIPDNVEAQTTAGYTAPAATSNKLGLNISYLSGLTLEDTDFDGTPDYLDNDADGDGTPDIEENGMANVLANLDSDSDGLDDAFEGSNSNDLDVNDEIDTPILSILPDTDGDMALGGDLDYRDAIDEYYPSATLDFDGIDDHVGTSSFMTGYQDATIMAWIKLDPTFSTNGDVAGQSMFRMFINGGNRKLQSYIITNQNNSAYGTSSTEALTLNQWYHVAMSYTGATGALKMYINGNLDKQVTIPAGTLSTNATYTSHDFNIGRHSRLNNYFFKGCIDEVRVFDTVLTDHQLQQIVYQEIEQNGANVKGTIINKDIADLDSSATLPWNNLQGYFPMTNVFTNKTSDHSGKGRDANLYNITTVQRQTAPMPYETVADGPWTTEATWLHGDVWDIEDVANNKDWSIAHIKHDVTTNASHGNLGLFIDTGKTLSVSGDNAITNSWYLQLDGTIDLAADSQLVQGNKSDLVTSATGKILRRQEGNADKFWYNYWSAPVGSLNATSLSDNNGPTNNTNNTPFNLDMLKDGLGTDLQFTTAYDELGKISNRWLYCFQNGITYYDWIAINEGSSLSPGIGYTQKGTGIGAAEQQYIFEGKPNNGTILIPATDVSDAFEAANGGESVEGVTFTSTLIGNPYPSALDARQFITDNAGVIQGTILLWEQWSGNSHWLSEYEGGYGFINNFTTARAYQYSGIPIANQSQTEGIKLPTFYLPVGQGFYVEVVNDGNIEFNNGQRVFVKEADADDTDPENGSTFLRGAEAIGDSENTEEDFQLIRIEFSTSNGASRRFVLGFGENTTDAFDYGMDGGLITTPPSDDMGSLLNDGQYVIQAFSPITEDKEIDLVFHSSG
ncbi:MAG: LamG domain-containing protein, partial [Bacteroidia bacterium]|nr:LamG domain-containing protein [Bacteroidia bacterium]